MPVAAGGRERPTARGDAATVAATPDSLAPVRRRGGLLLAALAVLALVGGATAFIAFADRASPAPAAEPEEATSRVATGPETGAAAEPAPEPAPIAAERAFVTVDIVGAPEGTEVFWGPEGLSGTAPGSVQLARGEAALTLLLRAAGH